MMYKKKAQLCQKDFNLFLGGQEVLLTEVLENGLRGNIEEVYKILGRPEDASLGGNENGLLKVNK